MRALSVALGKLLAPPPQRRADPHRKAREEAKKLAAAHGIEIERLRDGGFNVYPPKDFAGDDPHDGDHFANDWDEVREHVRAYVPATGSAA